MNSKINIVVLGGNGQLGCCLFDQFEHLKDTENDFNVTYLDKDTCDITNFDELKKTLKSIDGLKYVINCAAYTNVSKAETDYDTAYSINTEAVGYLATICKTYGYKLIHISTDFVFDGKKHSPYTYNDVDRNPLNVYGLTKKLGEDKIFVEGGDYLIIRTSWLYSEYGNNFVKKISEKILDPSISKIEMVANEYGCPTYAQDLAYFIVNCIVNEEINGAKHNGVYHFSNLGSASWYDLSVGINNALICQGSLGENKVVPIYKNKFDNIKRPTYSVMIDDRISNSYNRHWLVALEECINILISEK